ncbi:MAG TPA: hypothetical protein PL033_12220 [Candidatus Brocadiia bacterium]|nr:hypothetical protein [Candidatus Brocadiia bacterium]
MNDCILKINGTLRNDVEVRRVSFGYTGPSRAELFAADRLDAASGLLENNDLVQIWHASESSENLIFHGWIYRVIPGSVATEGVSYLALDRRARLADAKVRVNGGYSYAWNRRGFHCDHGAGAAGPGGLNSLWTTGEILIDILEHALGVPEDGSAIPSHHADASYVTEPFLSASDYTYIASDVLAMDAQVTEFSVNGESLAEAITRLVDATGGDYGWRVAPDGRIRVVNHRLCPTVSVRAGEEGHYVDEAGKDYNLEDNRLSFNLDGVFTRVTIQGDDGTDMVMPANVLEGENEETGNSEVLLVSSDEPGWHSVWRLPHDQERMSWRPVSSDVPEGWGTFPNGPRLYRGTREGGKIALAPTDWFYNPQNFMIYVWPGADWELGEDETLWGWYYYNTPFKVTAGPSGSAYSDYGFDAEYVIYDPEWKSPTGWPQSSQSASDAMAQLAAELVAQYGDARICGTVTIDAASRSDLDLERRISFANLDGNKWSDLDVGIMQTDWEPARRRVTHTVAHRITALDGYREARRRMELSAFMKNALYKEEKLRGCLVRQALATQPDTEDYLKVVSASESDFAPNALVRKVIGYSRKYPVEGEVFYRGGIDVSGADMNNQMMMTRLAKQEWSHSSQPDALPPGRYVEIEPLIGRLAMVTAVYSQLNYVKCRFYRPKIGLEWPIPVNGEGEFTAYLDAWGAAPSVSDIGVIFGGSSEISGGGDDDRDVKLFWYPLWAGDWYDGAGAQEGDMSVPGSYAMTKCTLHTTDRSAHPHLKRLRIPCYASDIAESADEAGHGDYVAVGLTEDLDNTRLVVTRHKLDCAPVVSDAQESGFCASDTLIVRDIAVINSTNTLVVCRKARGV